MRIDLLALALVPFVAAGTSADSLVDSVIYPPDEYVIEGETLTCGGPPVLHDEEYVHFRGTINGVTVDHAYLGLNYAPGSGQLIVCSQTIGTTLWNVFLVGSVEGVGYG